MPKLFTLSFNKDEQEAVETTNRSANGRRRSSVKLLPSVLTHEQPESDHVNNKNVKEIDEAKKKPFFYNLDSDDYFDSEDENDEKSVKQSGSSSNESEINFPNASKTKSDYVWFGQNRS